MNSQYLISLGQKSSLDKSLPRTKVSLENCLLGQLSLGQLSPWTMAPWTIVAEPWFGMGFLKITLGNTLHVFLAAMSDSRSDDVTHPSSPPSFVHTPFFEDPKKLNPSHPSDDCTSALPCMHEAHITHLWFQNILWIIYPTCKINNRISFARNKNASDQLQLENRPPLKFNFRGSLFSTRNLSEAFLFLAKEMRLVIL